VIVRSVRMIRVFWCMKSRRVVTYSVVLWGQLRRSAMSTLLTMIGPDDVQRVARKYINPESIQIVAVGEAAKIKSVLEKFGPVEMYDTEGKMK